MSAQVTRWMRSTAVGPIGLFLGRLANFVNGELWGRTTDVPWAMVFPTGGPVPRHPSQLYEATLEGLEPNGCPADAGSARRRRRDKQVGSTSVPRFWDEHGHALDYR